MLDLSQKFVLQGKKAPAFVAIYEDLYRRLESEEFKPGDQLPPEITLAEEYSVSRNTLRQALAILREDGRIYNIQGKGSYVSEQSNAKTVGFERLINPVFCCSNVPCTKNEVSFMFSPTALIVQQKLNLSPNDIALIADVTHYHNDTPISYTFVEVPVKYIPGNIVDLSDDESVKTFLNDLIYESAVSSLSRVTFSMAEESIGQFLLVPMETQLIFIEEILKNAANESFALCKHYLLPEYYSVVINRKP